MIVGIRLPALSFEALVLHAPMAPRAGSQDLLVELSALWQRVSHSRDAHPKPHHPVAAFMDTNCTVRADLANMAHIAAGEKHGQLFRDSS